MHGTDKDLCLNTHTEAQRGICKLNPKLRGTPWFFILKLTMLCNSAYGGLRHSAAGECRGAGRDDAVRVPAFA